MSSDAIDEMSKNIQALEKAIDALHGKLNEDIIVTINQILAKIRDQTSAIEMVITKYNFLNAAISKLGNQISKNTAGRKENRADIVVLESYVNRLLEEQEEAAPQSDAPQSDAPQSAAPQSDAPQSDAEDTEFQEVEGFIDSSDEDAAGDTDDSTIFKMSFFKLRL